MKTAVMKLNEGKRKQREGRKNSHALMSYFNSEAAYVTACKRRGTVKVINLRIEKDYCNANIGFPRP
jgi:hypothetical protein